MTRRGVAIDEREVERPFSYRYFSAQTSAQPPRYKHSASCLYGSASAAAYIQDRLKPEVLRRRHRSQCELMFVVFRDGRPSYVAAVAA